MFWGCFGGLLLDLLTQAKVVDLSLYFSAKSYMRSWNLSFGSERAMSKMLKTVLLLSFEVEQVNDHSMARTDHALQESLLSLDEREDWKVIEGGSAYHYVTK